MGGQNSRLQPTGPGYAQNLLFHPDYQDGGGTLGRRKTQTALQYPQGYSYGYGAAYPQAQAQAQPMYANGYVVQYPAGYPQVPYQQPQGVQYYMQQPQPQMTMPQPQPTMAMPQQQSQMTMQPQMQMPQPQMQMQMPQPQPQPQFQGQAPQQAQGHSYVIPQMIPQQQQQPQMPQPQPTPQPQFPPGFVPNSGSSNSNSSAQQDGRIPTPLPPASADAFGPPGPRPLTPIPNPLPTPPKDVYELEPYKSMLSRDLTGMWTPPPRAPSLEDSGSGSDGGRRRQRRRRRGFFASLTGGRGDGGERRGGLFRSFTGRDRDRDREYEPAIPAAVMDGPIPPVVPAPVPGMPAMPSPNAPTPVLSSSPSSMPPIRFNQQTEHYGFLPHSAHRVLYDGELYPSAFHLFEALKFLKNGRGDVAAQIRAMEDAGDVHPLSERMKEFAKVGFERELMDYMDEALYAKFTQHPQLRELLLNTGVADLIYAEASDPVWGEGTLGRGMNHLGIALRRLRERLRQEMAGQ